MLERLQQKAEEPDAPPVGRSVNFNVDLGNKDAVALALKHGLLTEDDLDDDGDDDGGDDDDKGDTPPKRRGYFPD